MEIHEPNKEYFCPTCSQAFLNTEEYKLHYKSDFHRYNIKRKMVKLPPVTLQQFSTKLSEPKAVPNNRFQCNECKKQFASAKTLSQHVASKGHNPDMIIEPRQVLPKASVVFAKNGNKCLFCQMIFASLLENQTHMEAQHSFFIAQREFCNNVAGLIEYLQEKIEVGHMCLTCENKKAKDFQSGDAVRKHMQDRGHKSMKTDEGYEEYEKYYDFSSLFEAKLKEQERIVPGIEFKKIKVIVGEQPEEDGEWEDEDEDGQNEWQSQEGSESGKKGQIHQQSRKVRVKTYQIMKPTLTANDQLLLPNGKLLGHRKYRHIYRQTLRLPHWFARQLKAISSSNITNALIDRRALLQVMKKQKQAKNDTVRLKKYNLSIGMTNNGLQKHFRCSTPL